MHQPGNSLYLPINPMKDVYNLNLRLTTTEAFSVVCEACVTAMAGEKFTHTPVVDEIGVFKNEAGRWSGYIHGRAERLAGFDIPDFISGTLPDRMGEFPCTLVLPDKEIPCLLIQWPGDGQPWKWRALIVAEDDLDGRNYAVRCFNERKTKL